VILKDEKQAASITADRYEFIRNVQRSMSLPSNVLLPPAAAKQLVPFEDAGREPLGK
jgi:general secretion pathway protein D